MHSSIYVSISQSIRDIYVSLPISLSIYLSICQTGQADVNMQPAGQKCQLKHGRETNGISHVYQTCQADAKKGHLKAKKGHLKAKNASKNMTWRRKLPIEQSIYLSTYLSIRPSIHAFIHLCLYLSIHRRYLCLSPYLPIYRSTYLSVKPARPT